MFNSILTIANSFDIQPDPGSIEDTDPRFTAPLPDTGELLAAVGVPAHAIREVLASRTYTGRGRLNRERGGAFREDERRRDRERPVSVR